MRMIAAFFSMLMPGVGQLYNGQLLKGIILLAIEFFINTKGSINQAIYLDFNGFHQAALEIEDYQYTLFYPGLYVFAVWDALFYAKPGARKESAGIFLVAGFLGEFSAIFAPHLPMPAVMGGLVMVIPMVGAMIYYRK